MTSVVNGSNEEDLFKESFKYYKSKSPMPSFKEVYDFDDYVTPKQNVRRLSIKNNFVKVPWGILPIATWKCYEFYESGLKFIRNPFTPQGERYWLAKCLLDYPKSPNIVNLRKEIFDKEIIDDWWESLQKCEDKNLKLNIKSSMRWTTLGYHHDWDTKVYSESSRNKFPEDLSKLTQFIANIIGFNDYSAEAAIVNYYPIGTTLAGHTDHSESNLEAPLFSFSFGQTAIFLLGGQTRKTKPNALLLKSGDIVVMSKRSRLSYHAVPRVFKTDKSSWNDFNSILENDEQPDAKKFRKTELKSDENFYMDMELWENCNNNEFWHPFSIYLEDSRVNINVRQVLKKGQINL